MTACVHMHLSVGHRVDLVIFDKIFSADDDVSETSLAHDFELGARISSPTGQVT